jgi:hypothetical protein
VVELDEARGRATVELEQTLTSPSLGATPPVGQRVTGPFAVFNPKRATAPNGCEDTRAAPLVVDAQVLVTFPRMEYERVGCTNCPNGCDAACVPAPDPPPLESPFWVLPWADQYDFAGTALHSTELSTLSDYNECASRFPAPLTECNDTVGPSFACTLAPGASPRAWFGLVVLALAGTFRRLARGRRPRSARPDGQRDRRSPAAEE